MAEHILLQKVWQWIPGDEVDGVGPDRGLAIELQQEVNNEIRMEALSKVKIIEEGM